MTEKLIYVFESSEDDIPSKIYFDLNKLIEEQLIAPSEEDIRFYFFQDDFDYAVPSLRVVYLDVRNRQIVEIVLGEQSEDISVDGYIKCFNAAGEQIPLTKDKFPRFIVRESK